MRTTSQLLAAAALLVLSACSGKDTDSDGGTDSDGPDPFESCSATDGQSPSVVEAIIDCLPPHQDGADRFLQLSVVATDPQGDFTLSQFQDNKFLVYLAANGQEIYNTAIACDQDNAGSCATSVAAPSANVDCGAMDNYRFAVIIADDEGNLSPECTAVED